jgi:hypothetical protein
LELYNTRTKVVNEVLQNAHAEAMRWLEKVSEGKINPGLPPKVDTNNQASTFMKLGGRKGHQNHW